MPGQFGQFAHGPQAAHGQGAVVGGQPWILPHGRARHQQPAVAPEIVLVDPAAQVEALAVEPDVAPVIAPRDIAVVLMKVEQA